MQPSTKDFPSQFYGCGGRRVSLDDLIYNTIVGLPSHFERVFCITSHDVQVCAIDMHNTLKLHLDNYIYRSEGNDKKLCLWIECFYAKEFKSHTLMRVVTDGKVSYMGFRQRKTRDCAISGR